MQAPREQDRPRERVLQPEQPLAGSFHLPDPQYLAWELEQPLPEPEPRLKLVPLVQGQELELRPGQGQELELHPEQGQELELHPEQGQELELHPEQGQELELLRVEFLGQARRLLGPELHRELGRLRLCRAG